MILTSPKLKYFRGKWVNILAPVSASNTIAYTWVCHSGVRENWIGVDGRRPMWLRLSDEPLFGAMKIWVPRDRMERCCEAIILLKAPGPSCRTERFSSYTGFRDFLSSFGVDRTVWLWIEVEV